MVKDSSKGSKDGEELKRLDTELKEMTHELNDLLNLNEELAVNIEVKDQEISDRDEKIKYLRETQSADLEQWGLERTSTFDSLKCEVNVSHEKVKKLNFLKERHIAISSENDNLRVLIESATNQINQDRINHNLAMHTKNVDMADARSFLEQKLKRDLTTMDITYEKQAFDLFSMSKKNAMFENAKLKDEVSIQGMGMANLGSRNERQMASYKANKKYADGVADKCNRLRYRLMKYQTKKFKLCKEIKVIEEEQAHLIAKRDALSEKLSHYDELKNIAKDKKACLGRIDEENTIIALWKERFNLYQTLYNEIKPTSENEQLGLYEGNTFKFDKDFLKTLPSSQDKAVYLSLSRPGSAEAHSMGSTTFDPSDLTASMFTNSQLAPTLQSYQQTAYKYSLVPDDIKYYMNEDKYLKRVFAAVQGEEKNFCTVYDHMVEEHDKASMDEMASGNEEESANKKTGECRNMLSWISLKILEIWYSTRLPPRGEPDYSRQNSRTSTATGNTYPSSEQYYGASLADYLRSSDDDGGESIGESIEGEGSIEGSIEEKTADFSIDSDDSEDGSVDSSPKYTFSNPSTVDPSSSTNLGSALTVAIKSANRSFPSTPGSQGEKGRVEFAEEETSTHQQSHSSSAVSSLSDNGGFSSGFPGVVSGATADDISALDSARSSITHESSSATLGCVFATQEARVSPASMVRNVQEAAETKNKDIREWVRKAPAVRRLPVADYHLQTAPDRRKLLLQTEVQPVLMTHARDTGPPVSTHLPRDRGKFSKKKNKGGASGSVASGKDTHSVLSSRTPPKSATLRPLEGADGESEGPSSVSSRRSLSRKGTVSLGGFTPFSPTVPTSFSAILQQDPLSSKGKPPLPSHSTKSRHPIMSQSLNDMQLHAAALHSLASASSNSEDTDDISALGSVGSRVANVLDKDHENPLVTMKLMLNSLKSVASIKHDALFRAKLISRKGGTPSANQTAPL